MLLIHQLLPLSDLLGRLLDVLLPIMQRRPHLTAAYQLRGAVWILRIVELLVLLLEVRAVVEVDRGLKVGGVLFSFVLCRGVWLHGCVERVPLETVGLCSVVLGAVHSRIPLQLI